MDSPLADLDSNYDCSGDEGQMLAFADGVNNLRSVNWQSRVHAFKCRIENEGYVDP
jgi:hypothetical protein